MTILCNTSHYIINLLFFVYFDTFYIFYLIKIILKRFNNTQVDVFFVFYLFIYLFYYYFNIY